MSATEYTDDDVRAAVIAVLRTPRCCSMADDVRVVLRTVAPAIVARERRRAVAAEQRADAYEAALTEERTMAHETIRALQAQIDRLTEARS